MTNFTLCESNANQCLGPSFITGQQNGKICGMYVSHKLAFGFSSSAFDERYLHAVWLYVTLGPGSNICTAVVRADVGTL
jgi:hypothetical protein